MADKQLDNSIFIMYVAFESYKKQHKITSAQFLELDKKFSILSYIAKCPDIFDSMTESEMVKEIDFYVSPNK